MSGGGYPDASCDYVLNFQFEVFGVQENAERSELQLGVVVVVIVTRIDESASVLDMIGKISGSSGVAEQEVDRSWRLLENRRGVGKVWKLQRRAWRLQRKVRRCGEELRARSL